MEKVDYIEAPLPLITARHEWHLFSRRALPVICAQLTREELLQIVGIDAVQESVSNGSSIPSLHDRTPSDISPQDRSTSSDQPRHPAPRTGTASSDISPQDRRASSDQPSHPAPRVRTASTEGGISFQAANEGSPSPKHRMKPPGEPNRPGSGGYSLEKYMVESCGWTKDEFAEVQARVQELAEGKLDVNLSFQKQVTSTLLWISEAFQVKKKFPVTRGYEQCWPIRDMLKVYLKSTSEAYRRRRMRVERS
ncbi:hypothetical protein C8R46DRAFT_1212503 [Mycena filopes]|nr:hypothetical protein C8R46DRAFT_1212503 [Mycena filopes]